MQNSRSLTATIAALIQAKCQPESDAEITIAKSLLSDSYRGNPCLLASKVLDKLDPELWKDSAGYQTPKIRTHVTIKLFRKEKLERRISVTPSIKQLIKRWLYLNLPKFKRLRIPIEGIPKFYFAHPEQLVYNIKLETETPIKIIKAQKCWMIARK